MKSGDEFLAEGLAELGIEEANKKLLTRYIEEIELFNPAYGLVKVKDREELIVKHILDSLAPLNIINSLLCTGKGSEISAGPKKIADVGSGAGLPGIPLAVCMQGVHFSLIERMGRRVGFLQNTLAVLNLANAEVEETEMEAAPLNSDGTGRFDIVVFRAFRPLEPDIYKGLVRLLSPNGILAAYKGRKEAVEEEMTHLLSTRKKGTDSSGSGVSGPGSPSWELLPLNVPFLQEERHLLLIRPGAAHDPSA